MIEPEGGQGPIPQPQPQPQQPENLLRLAPYLVGRCRRGIVGSSRYAQRLREQIRQAAADSKLQPVLISGEPGLEKDNIAALIHYGSPTRRLPLLRVDGASLGEDGALLFGTVASDGENGLLACVAGAGLLIDQLDRVPKTLQPALQQLAQTGQWQPAGPGGRPRQFSGRVYFTTETAAPLLDRRCKLIRVPPLRVRRQDLGEWLRYGVRQRSLKLGWQPAPQVPETVIKRLQSYDFPNNLRELEVLIYRAMQQARRQGLQQSVEIQNSAGLQQSAEPQQPAELPEDVFWTDDRNPRPRFDLWRWKPALRNWMRSPRLWNTLLFGLVSWIFVLVNLWLWLGPQDRAHNGALNLFWAWWWPLILITYPLVGRLWCSFCPFMVWGEIVQWLAGRLGWQPRPWPRGDGDAWGAPLLAAGFAAILLWEELADLENSAWRSSTLLLLITAGAVLGSLLFEKRFWCRYLCPVGGMNGLFAKLSISELRAQVGTCSGSCSSYGCFKGGPAGGEGMATPGCPLATHPAHLADNRNCVLCLTCAQACPHRSVQLRLRPPAADLQREMQPPAAEAGLILVLAGGVCLHHWQRLLGWLPGVPSSLHAWPMLPRLAVAAAALALPAAGFLLLRPIAPARQRRLLLYALLPLLWGLLLARHLPLGLAEAGLVLPVSIGLAWPSWSADPHVVAFCQSVALLVGLGGSLVLMRRLGPQGGWRLALASGSCLLLAAAGRWLVAVPS